VELELPAFVYAVIGRFPFVSNQREGNGWGVELLQLFLVLDLAEGTE
jgi:hypothetical protein